MITFMDPTHVLQLAVIAAQLSGYDLPHYAQLPTVMELSSEQMHRYACPANVALDDPCFNDIGLYHDGDGIAVDVQYLATTHMFDEDTVVVHELTHWLQYVNGWGGTECPHIQARENEAYRIQNLYSQRYGNGRQQPAAIVCSIPVELH